MKLVTFCKGKRGLACLKLFEEKGVELSMIVLQQGEPLAGEIGTIAQKCGAEVFTPSDPNSKDSLHRLRKKDADVFVLAGYGLILKKECLSIPKLNCINLHGGKLPQYRGSSPLNWALIKNETNIGISIIEVDEGIDSGDILAEDQMDVSPETNISDLHAWANHQFPQLLHAVLEQISNGTLNPQKQKHDHSAYYPRRFPDDGMVFWDQLTAREAHDRIRALTKPYPCARTFFGNREVMLLKSELTKLPYYGEAGRIYRKNNGKLLIGAMDRALWITSAEFAEDQSSLYLEVKRYDLLSTIREAAIKHYRNSS